MEISLNGLRFYGKIGVLEQERIVGNEYEVNIKVKYQPSLPVSDDLSSTISYADIFEIVRQRIERGGQLLEKVAYDISETISERWTNIIEGETEIIKLKPPIPGIEGSCGVKYFF